MTNNKDKLEKRIFILDLSTGFSYTEDLAYFLAEFGEKEDIVIKSDIGRERILKELPEGYDAYFIHLSSINDYEQLANLKRNQPWSKIFVQNNSIDNQNELTNKYPQSWAAIDKFIYILEQRDIEDMIKILK